MDPTRTQTVAALVGVIRAALPEAEEGVKWNAPNFSVDGQDLVTLNLPPKGGVRVVLHRGAKAADTKTGNRLLPDTDQRVAWATDQRAYVAFADPGAVAEQADWLTGLLRAWLGAVRG